MEIVILALCLALTIWCQAETLDAETLAGTMVASLHTIETGIILQIDEAENLPNCGIDAMKEDARSPSARPVPERHVSVSE